MQAFDAPDTRASGLGARSTRLGARRARPKPRRPAHAPSRRTPIFRSRLVIFVKAPVAGRAKTRLARELGLGVAMRFARQSAAALLARVACDRRWETIIAGTRDGLSGGRFWSAGVGRCAQGGGTLGQRMQRVMELMPPGPVVIVGTDVPVVRAMHIARAFRALGRHDAVFGPASDGGYWLVGLRRRPRILRPFADVRWSSAHAFADTLKNLKGSSVSCLAVLSDVDTAKDFIARADTFGRRVLPALNR